MDRVPYCGGSEFKYPRSVAKVSCSIEMENNKPATPNPTLNLHNSVNKCKSDIKTLMQPCYFNILMWI